MSRIVRIVSQPWTPTRVGDELLEALGSADPPSADERVDLAGALVTPGLVNTHHHLYQTLTRARAQQADLFAWLRELYPVWAGIDAEAEYAAARTGLAELALSGLRTFIRERCLQVADTPGPYDRLVQSLNERTAEADLPEVKSCNTRCCCLTFS